MERPKLKPVDSFTGSVDAFRLYLEAQRIICDTRLMAKIREERNA